MALAAATRRLAASVEVVGAGWFVPFVKAGAVVAGLGSLLALIAGIGRTSLAMTREGDLPAPLGTVSTRTQIPHVAEITVLALGLWGRVVVRR